jgi:hypothetical protein
MHALNAWDLKFQVCLGYTFTPATLVLTLVTLGDETQIHRQQRVDRLLIGTACLNCFGQVVMSPANHTAVVPQSGAKNQICSTV